MEYCVILEKRLVKDVEARRGARTARVLQSAALTNERLSLCIYGNSIIPN